MLPLSVYLVYVATLWPSLRPTCVMNLQHSLPIGSYPLGVTQQGSKPEETQDHLKDMNFYM